MEKIKVYKKLANCCGSRLRCLDSINFSKDGKV